MGVRNCPVKRPSEGEDVLITFLIRQLSEKYVGKGKIFYMNDDSL